MKNYFVSSRALLLIIMLAVLTMLAACGKTGALYLPDDPAAEQSSTQKKKAKE